MGTKGDKKISEKQTNPACPGLLAFKKKKTWIGFFLFSSKTSEMFLSLSHLFILSEHFAISHKTTAH